MTVRTLTPEALEKALSLRDLSNPAEGSHAMQLLMNEMVSALQKAWGCEVMIYRESPIIPVEDNYDKLNYPKDGAARDARYTRYVTQDSLLRTMTSAMIPRAMRSVADHLPDDILLVCPGLVYRRDCIDKIHSAEPHQIDLWRVCRNKKMGRADLEAMIKLVVEAILPDRPWRIEPRVHPYTLDGLQVDVLYHGEWIEICECGLAHPAILAANIPNHEGLSGLAMGPGLDRLLMLRKGIQDIRLLRSTDPRVLAQMQDLEPYREVSSMPPVVRDLSLVVEAGCDAEEIGDRVRDALGEEVAQAEMIHILSETPYEALPLAAKERLGIGEGQKNILLRIVLRALDRTLTAEECNATRDKIYKALHQGSVWQWAVKDNVG